MCLRRILVTLRPSASSFVRTLLSLTSVGTFLCFLCRPPPYNVHHDSFLQVRCGCILYQILSTLFFGCGCNQQCRLGLHRTASSPASQYHRSNSVGTSHILFVRCCSDMWRAASPGSSTGPDLWLQCTRCGKLCTMHALHATFTHSNFLPA